MFFDKIHLPSAFIKVGVLVAAGYSAWKQHDFNSVYQALLGVLVALGIDHTNGDH